MAVSKSWGDLKAELASWNKQRLASAADQIKQDADRLKFNIIQEIQETSQGKTPKASELEAKTTMSSAAKQELLMPKSKQEKNSPTDDGISLYTNSVVVVDESSGTNVIQVVKLDNMGKKDGTTGMSLDKIAKAVEFGTSRSAPRPAWRRSLKKLEQTGAYKKKQYKSNFRFGRNLNYEYTTRRRN